MEQLGRDIEIKQQFKLSDEQKISILDDLLEQCDSQYALKIARTNENLNQQSTNSSYFYSILGNKQNKRTQNSNLLMKLKDLEKEHKNEDEDFKNQQEQPKNYRYYRESMRCFRCRKYGHYQTACPEEYSCVYCLSFDHNQEKCPQKIVCYRCYSFGHIANNCHQSNQGPYCNNCKRKHYGSCGFLTKGIQQFKQMFNTEYLHNHQQIICMVCLKYGHLICQNYQQYREYDIQHNKRQ